MDHTATLSDQPAYVRSLAVCATRDDSAFLFCSRDLRGVFVCAIAVQRRSNAKEKFERIAWAVAIVTVQSTWPDVERELTAEADIDSVAVREIAHIAKAHGIDRKNFRKIDILQDQLVPRFLHKFPARVNGVAMALVI